MQKPLPWWLPGTCTKVTIAKGNIDPDWKDESPMDFYAFMDALSKQKLEYAPTLWKFRPGDQLMRVSTQQNSDR